MQHAHNIKTFPHYNKTVKVNQSVIKSSHPKCINVAKPIHIAYNAVVIHASFLNFVCYLFFQVKSNFSPFSENILNIYRKMLLFFYNS